jgi:hypothetical protein
MSGLDSWISRKENILRFPQRLTQNEIKFKSAKANIRGQNIRVKGFLDDIAWILNAISR